MIAATGLILAVRISYQYDLRMQHTVPDGFRVGCGLA